MWVNLSKTNSEAVKNGNYHQKIKSILTANGNGPKKPSNTTITATATATAHKPSATSTKAKSGSSHDGDIAESVSSDKETTKATSIAESKDEKAASRVNSRFFRSD